MKKVNFILIIALILAMASFSGCEKADTESAKNVKLPTSPFVLDESCNWINITPNTVHIINSIEELANCLNCGNDLLEYDADFSTQTLLLVSGGASNGISNITSELTKNGGEYTLNINIMLNNTMEAPGWVVSLLTDKLTTNYIDLNLVVHQPY